jgi:predicted phosphodiesterase
MIDFCSDLHIDQWDTSIFIKYPHGPQKNFPFQISNQNGFKYLIVAGDISDDLDLSLSYLEDSADQYDKILFVDGNHEHVNKYPKLYTTPYINQKIINEKIVYLPENDFIDGSTVFIGVCGWWNYSSAKGNYDLTYFKNWIPSLTEEDCLEFILNVKERAKQEAKILKEKIEKYEKDPKCQTIVIITHCLPIDNLPADEVDTNYNSHFREIIDGNYSKLTYWLFGHTHQKLERKKSGILFMTHPRGRPEDYDRKVYSLKSINI